MVKKHLLLLVLILLVAASLRILRISDVPPGLTHDEADHGLDAWGVVNGNRPIYFTVGYGREPLYDYATAVVMAITGPSFLAGRLTAAFFGLIIVAGSYIWVRRTFGIKEALLTAGLMAFSFYAIMTSRQALRSITLPATFLLAVIFLWRGIETNWREPINNGERLSREQERERWSWKSYGHFILSGLALGLSIYTYPPARIMWVLFPLTLILLSRFNNRRSKPLRLGAFLNLIVALVIAAPITIFLMTNPTAEARINELSIPIKQMFNGDFELILQNLVVGFKMLLIEGDGNWRYNIADRPILQPILAILFIVGVLLSIGWIIKGFRTRNNVLRATSASFALMWLILGLLPALITGADSSTPRVIGVLPVLYLFPALTLSWILGSKEIHRKVSLVIVIVLLGTAGIISVRDYFHVWAQSPEVRVQYESTAVATIKYLEDNYNGQAAISTTTPGRFHNPAVTLLIQKNPEINIRWFDGRYAILFPRGNGGLVGFTGFASLNPYLEPYFSASEVDRLDLPPTYIDQPVILFEAEPPQETNLISTLDQELRIPTDLRLPVIFDDAVELIGYEILTPVVEPGGVARIVSLWRAYQPVDQAVIFVHIVNDEGIPLAQDDRLEVPSYYWEAGDLFLQLHEIEIPATIGPGEYDIMIGVYKRPDLVRLQPSIENFPEDQLQLKTLELAP